MEIRAFAFREGIKLPRRAYPTDTGLDIYMPSAGKIMPLETLVIPAGFGIEVPNGYTARMQVRTSVAALGIIVQGCAIDAGYTGELHIIIHNVSGRVFRWEKNDRLCYIEVYPCIYPQLVPDQISQRNKNCLGSTGK